MSAALADSARIAPARPRPVRRLGDIPLPCWVQPKKDGVRILVGSDGAIRTRSGRPVDAPDLLARLQAFRLRDLDCELVATGGFNATLSLLQSGKGHFTLWGLDRISDPLRPRYMATSNRLADLPPPRTIGGDRYCPVPSEWITTRKGLAAAWDRHMAAGEEGIVTRAGHAPYGADIYKLKTVRDDEAVFERTEAAAGMPPIIVAIYRGQPIRVQTGKRQAGAVQRLTPGDRITFTYHSLHASGQPREARFLRSRTGDPS